MRCRKTAPDDIAQLKTLWKRGFGDTDAEIDRFFASAYPRCTSFAAEDGGALCAALYALPQTLIAPGRREKAAYLYAVTTAEESRGRGVCRTLMAYAEKQLQEQRFACTLLVPGEASLFRFYEALGYRAQCAHALQTLAPPDARGEARRVEPAAYDKLREALLGSLPHVRYDANDLAYSGAQFYALTLGGRAGCAAVYHAPGGACVCELLPDAGMLPALCGALPQTPVRCRAPGGAQPFAMLKWLGQPQPELEPVYLAFAFE